jgi:hypothetical protein
MSHVLPQVSSRVTPLALTSPASQGCSVSMRCASGISNMIGTGDRSAIIGTSA